MPEPPESFPVNALVAIPGTPLEKNERVTVQELLRTIATARIVLPTYVTFSQNSDFSTSVSICGSTSETALTSSFLAVPSFVSPLVASVTPSLSKPWPSWPVQTLSSPFVSLSLPFFDSRADPFLFDRVSACSLPRPPAGPRITRCSTAGA